jgi:hypothetical protein
MLVEAMPLARGAAVGCTTSMHTLQRPQRCQSHHVSHDTHHMLACRDVHQDQHMLLQQVCTSPLHGTLQYKKTHAWDLTCSTPAICMCMSECIAAYRHNEATPRPLSSHNQPQLLFPIPSHNCKTWQGQVKQRLHACYGLCSKQPRQTRPVAEASALSKTSMHGHACGLRAATTQHA